jgi:hypothetical protein
VNEVLGTYHQLDDVTLQDMEACESRRVAQPVWDNTRSADRRLVLSVSVTCMGATVMGYRNLGTRAADALVLAWKVNDRVLCATQSGSNDA